MVMFIGLNPSTADEVQLDPTVRRCVNFSKTWGYGSICMTNIFAIRSTNPKVMLKDPEPIGEDNNHWLIKTAEDSDLIVAAWGNHGIHLNRGDEVASMLDKYGVIQCLDITKKGQPKHPLYIRADQKLRPF